MPDTKLPGTRAGIPLSLTMTIYHKKDRSVRPLSSPSPHPAAMPQTSEKNFPSYKFKMTKATPDSYHYPKPLVFIIFVGGGL